MVRPRAYGCGVVAPPITSNPYGDHESREGLLIPSVADPLGAKRDGGWRGDLDNDTYAVVPLLEIGKGSSSRGKGPNGAGFGEPGDPMFTLQAGAQHGVAIGVDLQNCALGGDVAGTLDTTRPTRGGGQAVMAFDLAQITSATNRTSVKPGQPASTLNGSGDMHVAWSIMPQNSGRDYKARQVDVAQPVMAGGPVGGNQGGDYIQTRAAVRRLTPEECEALQGFPRLYTRIPYGKKSHGSGWSADGPRYRALGNSFAVPVVRWIGERIAAQDAILAAEAQRKQEAA